MVKKLQKMADQQAAARSGLHDSPLAQTIKDSALPALPALPAPAKSEAERNSSVTEQRAKRSSI